jgi:hypothetical protein
LKYFSVNLLITHPRLSYGCTSAILSGTASLSNIMAVKLNATITTPQELLENLFTFSITIHDLRCIQIHRAIAGYTVLQMERTPRKSKSTDLSMEVAPPAQPDSPAKLLALWNWKSAILSIVLRVPVFAVAAIRRGPEAVAAAAFTEAAVCGFNAGCYAAVVQVIRNRKPVWLTALFIGVGLPALGQVIEYGVHGWRGTPHRTAAVIVSTILGAVSSLFNWYAMKRGTLLVGNEGTSFWNDVRRMPLLIGRFLLVGPCWLLRRVSWMAVRSS